MRSLVKVVVCLLFVGSVRADIVYLQNGQVYSGKVAQMDSTSLQIELSDGNKLTFLKPEIFQVTDDAGKIIYDGSGTQTNIPVPLPSNLTQTEGLEKSQSDHSTPLEFRRVMHFPYWPLLGGTLIFGYLGVDQLQKSTDTYKESEDLEKNSLPFNSKRDRSQKEKTWGQIGVAAAIVCLIVGATPKFEKVPVQQTVRLVPTANGFVLTMNF